VLYFVFAVLVYASLFRSRYLGAVSGGEALRDDPNNGCGGDYVYARKQKKQNAYAKGWDSYNK